MIGPIVLFVVALALIVIGARGSALAPFVYSLF